MSLLAAGYTGPPERSAASALTTWTFDPVAAALVLLLAFAYIRGVRRLRAQGQQWPVGRSVWFGLGLLVLVVESMSFLGAYAHTLFWVTAAQMALLLTVIPVLLVLGGPVSLLTRAAPGSEPRVERVLASSPIRVLTFPLIGSLPSVQRALPKDRLSMRSSHPFDRNLDGRNRDIHFSARDQITVVPLYFIRQQFLKLPTTINL